MKRKGSGDPARWLAGRGCGRGADHARAPAPGRVAEKIGKISVYLQSSVKARDEGTLANFIRFAHLNLDAVLVQALEVLVWRPRLASKTDEQKKAVALQKTFDRRDDPAKAMLEHLSEQLRSAEQISGGRALGA